MPRITRYQLPRPYVVHDCGCIWREDIDELKFVFPSPYSNTCVGAAYWAMQDRGYRARQADLIAVVGRELLEDYLVSEEEQARRRIETRRRIEQQTAHLLERVREGL